MKRIGLFIIFVWFFAFAGFARATQSGGSVEEITNFASNITINQDTSLSIVEKIDYFTPDEKHGIFRYIPEKYRRNGVVVTNPISEISVSDSDGKAIPFQTIRDSKNVTLKIGNPDITFSGNRSYVISYKVGRAILRQKDFDELYWDITGEGWSFPIRKAEVDIRSPFASMGESVCFTGTVGGNESRCTQKKSTDLNITSQEPINYGENFTVAVKLDKNNHLIFPTQSQIWTEYFVNNFPLLLMLLPGLIMFIYWYKKGRDYRFISPNIFDLDPAKPQGLRPLFEPVNIPIVYEPIKQMTPGEAGALLDEKVDNQDIVAEIVELARKKYLKIDKIEKKTWLSINNDYLFTKLKEPQKLPEDQQYLMDKIFESGDKVKLSDLKGTFYTHMTKVREIINKKIKENKWFTSNPQTARRWGLALAKIMSILVFIFTINTVIFLGSAWPILIMVISFGTAFILAFNMPQKTAVGTNLSLQAKGLRETIRLGKWREEIKEKHLFIEEILPFAISLGVINKLTKDMRELNIEPPKYMSGGFQANTIALEGFVNDFTHSATSVLSYNPSSSSAGGSGFSGGSSGGGGGGGGGGSW